MTIRIPVSNPAGSHADLVVQAINILTFENSATWVTRPPVIAAAFRLRPGEHGEAVTQGSRCASSKPL